MVELRPIVSKEDTGIPITAVSPALLRIPDLVAEGVAGRGEP